ncbi:MAG: hypothetical protein WCI27_09945 [Candidatus Omnitrophota bacterium]
MRLVGELLKKDIKRLRWGLWLLGALLMAHLFLSLNIVGLMSNGPQFEDYYNGKFLRLYTTSRELLSVVIILLTIILVQEDSLRRPGSGALTRPISWQTLLTSKVLFTLSFLVIPPVILELLALNFWHVTSSSITLSAYELLFWQVCLASFVFLLAAMVE